MLAGNNFGTNKRASISIRGYTPRFGERLPEGMPYLLAGYGDAESGKD